MECRVSSKKRASPWLIKVRIVPTTREAISDPTEIGQLCGGHLRGAGGFLASFGSSAVLGAGEVIFPLDLSMYLIQ